MPSRDDESNEDLIDDEEESWNIDGREHDAPVEHGGAPQIPWKTLGKLLWVLLALVFIALELRELFWQG